MSDMPKVPAAMISGSNEVSVLISFIQYWTFRNDIYRKQYNTLVYLTFPSHLFPVFY